jgi:hypothetical protein
MGWSRRPDRCHGAGLDELVIDQAMVWHLDANSYMVDIQARRNAKSLKISEVFSCLQRVET